MRTNDIFSWNILIILWVFVVLKVIIRHHDSVFTIPLLRSGVTHGKLKAFKSLANQSG